MDLKDVMIFALVFVDVVLLIGLIYFWGTAAMWKDLTERARRDSDRAQTLLDDAHVTIAKQNKLIRIMAFNDGIESPIEDDDDEDK